MTRTTKNTLKSILVLFVIASVSVFLLSLANHFIKVEIKLDLKTATLINSIAPTGYDDQTALNDKHIKMVDLTSGEYKIDLEAFNKNHKLGQVLAMYTSVNKDTSKTTLIVEASGLGFESGAIVMLVAYDGDNKISGIITKSQTQSYWDILNIDSIYKNFIGLGGNINSNQIATETGATASLNGIVGAVNIAHDFINEITSLNKGAQSKSFALMPDRRW